LIIRTSKARAARSFLRCDGRLKYTLSLPSHCTRLTQAERFRLFLETTLALIAYRCRASSITVSQYVSAFRFLFIETLHRHFLAEYIPFAKSRKRLPTVLSPEEVARLIDPAHNLYHRALLMTLYSTAIRRAELCRLKVRDTVALPRESSGLIDCTGLSAGHSTPNRRNNLRLLTARPLIRSQLLKAPRPPQPALPGGAD
jgi:integrase